MVDELVSIIMPSYNTAKYIKESIESIINQTYGDWELIIVDDCSNDETDTIVESFEDKRIRFLKNEKNVGAALSRNRALREAKGEWIAFLDSDELWTPDKLEKQIEFMKKNNIGCSCTYSTYIDENSSPLMIIDKCPKYITLQSLYLYNWIASITVIYHYPTVGLVQVADLKKRNDYALWLKVLKKTDCVCHPEVLAQYRIRKQSVSHDKLQKLIRSHYTLFRVGEERTVFSSVFLTCINMFFGIIRKIFYVKKYKMGDCKSSY